MTKVEFHWCLICVRLLPRRRWWQRGVLAPLPHCTGDAVPACRARADFRQGIRRDADGVRIP